MPDESTNDRIPFASRIELELGPVDLFRALSDLPRQVWLDSATAHDQVDDQLRPDDAVVELSRYSFLTADPIHELVAHTHDQSPWQKLCDLARALPTDFDPDLPPFQGGLLGVVGYESARWLEPSALADCDANQIDDLPTPAFSFGVFDWVLAIDHATKTTWLICQGFDQSDLLAGSIPTTSQRIDKANRRANQIQGLLADYADRKQDTKTDSPDLQSDSHVAVQSNFTSEAFQSSVGDIVDRIRDGDSFQVNLAQRLTTAATIDSMSMYLRLRESNPAPFAGFYDGGSYQVLSSSPEGFLQIRDSHVETRPIKGTVPRTGDPQRDAELAEQLLASEKDRAENIMIVDLMRNDLSKVCHDESVVVTQTCEIERYQFVQHLVSVVEGDLRDDVHAGDVLKSCFPGGSVTGAPKIEAMKTIAELEPNPRGPYCGSMGYISCGGNADFNILIRTVTAAGGRWQIPVGGGITARSIPVAEEAETWAKAAGMLKALPGSESRNTTDENSPVCEETFAMHGQSANSKVSEVL